MKLKTLTLKDFKGIQNFSVTTNGSGVTSIFGDNATGKTTIFDAFTWLLFDKDSMNSANFDIKALDESGKAASGLEHTVEAVLDFGDKETVLKKVYKEKWTKKRGSASREFTGHTTSYYIDEVPVKQKEFKAFVAEICDDDTSKILTDPRYFNESLHWQDRRKMLISACGDIDDSDVLDKMFPSVGDKDQYDYMANMLNKRKLEDHRKVIASRRQEINKELDKIPVRIDEVKAQQVETRKKADIESDLEAAKAELAEDQGILSEIKAGGEDPTLKTKLREIEGRIIDHDNKIAREGTKRQTERDQQRRQLKNAATDAGDAVNAMLRNLDRLKIDKGSLEKQIPDITAQMDKMRDQWFREDSRKFSFDQSSTCPTCGQDLPEEQLEAAREKAEADFNREKAENLAATSSVGKNKKAELDDINARIADLEKQIENAYTEIKALQAESEKASKALEEFDSQQEPEADDTARAELVEQKAAIEKQITEKASGVDPEAIAQGEESIKATETKIEALQKELLQIDSNKRIEARIQELKDQERKLSAEYEKLERELYLSEQFIRTKVSMLEGKINARFQLARFQLFTENINGGLEECCNTTFNGVPYASMNNAAKINVGLDICNTLAGHFKKSLPVFIDNAESVSQIYPTDAQQIRLIVSPEDKTLRIEDGGSHV